MSMPEEECVKITDEPAEVRAIVNSLYTSGALDGDDIYEIIKSDGTTTRLQLGGGLQQFAERIIQETYPGCGMSLLSSGEVTEA